MVNFMLSIAADLDNMTNLQPRGGCDDPNFSFLFKVKCSGCGEVSQKETSVVLNETVPNTNGRGKSNLIQKCKFCRREGSITMIPGRSRPLTQADSQAGKFAPLMVFESRGYEPLDFVFADGWKADSLSGTTFVDIDLSGGDFSEYDEDGECPVMISNLRATFEVVK